MYRTIARLGGVLLMLLGTLVLLGWFWNVGWLTTVLPGRIAMKPNTAIGFLFLGLALFLLTRLQQDSQHPTLVCRLRDGSYSRGPAYIVRVSFPR